MSLTTSKLILTIILIIWSFTILRSITIIISGLDIFRKANKDMKSVLYPIVNLFAMLDIAEVSTYFGILFFVPVLNMIALTLMSYKLGDAFKAPFSLKIGLVLCPIIFYAVLGKSKYQYKLRDDDYFRALASEKVDSINLMTQDELNRENALIDEEDNVTVDSVFKSNDQLREEPEKYKATKIDLLDMEKVKQSNEIKSLDDMMKTQSEINKEHDETIETLDL